VAGLNAVVYAFFFPMRIGVCWLMQLFVVGPRAWLITAALQVLQVLLVQRWLRKRIQRVIVRKNQAADVRVKCVEQAVDEMKITKFLGAESSREAQLATCRAREARLDGLVVIMNQGSAVIGFALAILNPVLGLLLKYYLTGTPWSLWLGLTYWGLNTQSISLIGQLHDKLPFVSNAMAALKRYRTIGELPTRPSSQNRSYQVGSGSFTQDDRPDSSLRLFGSEYSFYSATSSPKPVLWDPKLVVTPGQTCLVIGPTGCGKSSLLLALLGELAHGGGHDVTSKAIHGAVCGYTSQQVVLFAQSIRENIVSGRAFRTDEYKEALSDSCLVRDLDQIAGEDSAQIAAGGGSLSGGQQMRVALARSFYALFSAPATSHRMLLADDPMAALDAKVAAAVFQSGFMQSLHGCTRVIALGMLAYLDHPAVDTILFMQQGKIAFRGSISELLEASSKSSFSDSWLGNALAHSNIDTQMSQPRVAHTPPPPVHSFNEKRRRAAILPESLVTHGHGEKSHTGKVDSATVKRVVKIAGRWFFVVLVCHFTCQNLLRMYFSWEMTAYIALEQRDPIFGTLPLVGIVTVMVVLQIVYSLILANRGQRIITQLLKLAFARVMHCPLPVIQSKSKGEITSRCDRTCPTIHAISKVSAHCTCARRAG
jgi:ABC-type multidrug transport system fused ATPase/permease subunit